MIHTNRKLKYTHGLWIHYVGITRLSWVWIVIRYNIAHFQHYNKFGERRGLYGSISKITKASK